MKPEIWRKKEGRETAGRPVRCAAAPRFLGSYLPISVHLPLSPEAPLRGVGGGRYASLGKLFLVSP